MRSFTYARADTLDATITLLNQDQSGATRPLAGGTDLLTLMKAEITAPNQVVDIKRLGEVPRGLFETAEGVTLGALTTLSEIEKSDLLRQQYPALAEAVALAATPQLRNMATIGGNLLQRPRCWYFRNERFSCWLKGGEGCPAKDGENQHHALFGDGPCYAAHPSDPAAALLALDATVQLRGAHGDRHLPLSEFFALPEDKRRRETVIEDDELLLSITLPTPATGSRSTYFKAMDRKVWAFALAGVAVNLHMDQDKVADARIVLSGVAPIPWRVPAAEQALIGASLSDASKLEEVAALVLAEATPLGKNRYKMPLTQRLVYRALSSLVA